MQNSAPKFSVGQKVAVCTSDLSVVIPETFVVAYSFLPKRLARDISGEVRPFREGWYYKVRDAPLSLDGLPVSFFEPCLREVDDDDYEEQEEEEVVVYDSRLFHI